MRSRDRFGNVLCRPSRSSLPLQGKSCQGTGRPQPRSSPPRRPGFPSLPHPAAALALLLTARPLADSPAPSRRAATSPLPPCLFLIPPLGLAASRRAPRAGPASGVLCGAATMGPVPQGELCAPLGSAAAAGARAAAGSAPPRFAWGRWSSSSLRAGLASCRCSELPVETSSGCGSARAERTALGLPGTSSPLQRCCES